MPTSYHYFKEEVKQFILENVPTSSLILDLGAGCGTYSNMLKKYGYYMEGVEIHQPYIDQYDLADKYDQLHNVNLLDFKSFNHHHFVIIGDVLEHLSVSDAKDVISNYLNKGSNLLVAVPFLMEQGEYEGNTYETHLQPDLTPEIMNERYPELELLYGNNFYGYYINKNFWYHDKAFVLCTDKAYFDLAKKCIESIRIHTDTPILLYTINDNEDDNSWVDGLWDMNVEVINWVAPEVHGFTQRKKFIDRADLDIYKLLIQRPRIMSDALRHSKMVAYIDTDSLASPYIDTIFDLFDNSSSYPYFAEGVYDWLHIDGRGGAESRDDLSTTLEAPVCDLFGINQYVRERYRQTGYFVAGQNCKDFLSEWYWMCNHPTILKNTAWFAPYNEETIVNALLWKNNQMKGLPCMYVNGLMKNIQFTGEARIVDNWLRVPATEKELLVYHGEKDIQKIDDFIDYLKQPKKKKVLFLAPHLSTGGMPQFLLKRIEVIKDTMDVFVVEYQCYSLDFVVQRNAIKSLLGENFTTLFEDKMELFKIINQFNPDIIHIDEMSERLDKPMIQRLYDENRSYRIVETCHDISFNPNDKEFLPDLFLFCSSYHEQTFAGLDTNYATIEYPIDKKETGLKINEDFGDHKNVLNVGLWTPGKNQAEGIEIARKYPNMTFHFVGNQAGNFKDYWEPLMKNLPSNVKVWGERSDIDTFMKSADIFMFNSTWECNPLVLREAASHGLPIIARNLPQYGDMFTNYIQPIDTDLNTIKADYEIPINISSNVFGQKHILFYNEILRLEKSKQKISITQNFINQPFLEIKGASNSDFEVQFIDEDGVVKYDNVIKSNSWVKLNREYYTKWTALVFQDDKLIYENTLDYAGKRVFVSIDSKSLGDTIAWAPYALEFQRKHNCKVILSTFWNKILDYPELELVEPGVSVPCYGMYKLGWHYNTDKEPELCNTIPLQKAATNILGLDFEEIRPKLKYVDDYLPYANIVTIATNSTAGCKFWQKEDWQTLINYLTDKGYKVINVSKEKNPFDNCEQIEDTSMDNTMALIMSSRFFVGLSSGLSWLAWALKTPVVMISNFTMADHEFTDCIRITKTSVCHGCWNEKGIVFDKGDWNWCPRNKNFECHTSISADRVINEIERAGL